MRSSSHRIALVLAFALCLGAPFALTANGPHPSGGSCPALTAPAPSLAASIVAPDLAAPSPLPAAGGTIGVCASSCNPDTCTKGFHGGCVHRSCILGVFPSSCGAGDSCISLGDCN